MGRRPADPARREAIAALRAAGKGIAFVTNDGRHAHDDHVRKLWRLGFQASREEVVTVGGAIQHVLAERQRCRTAYVIGSAAMHATSPAPACASSTGTTSRRADVVVVAAHDDFDYAELRGAVQAVLAGADLLCGGRDATFPMPDGPWPGTGAIVAAVEAATGAARNVGKPEPQLFLTALDRLGPGRGARRSATASTPTRPAARAAGLDCAIVLTGADAGTRPRLAGRHARRPHARRPVLDADLEMSAAREPPRASADRQPHAGGGRGGRAARVEERLRALGVAFHTSSARATSSTRASSRARPPLARWR